MIGDPGWKAFARTVAGTFIFLVGVNLVLAHRDGFRRGLFLRRLAIIAGAAILVSIGTWFFMGDDFVYFGILHCIAVSSLLALPFLRTPPWATIIVAAICIAAPFFLADPLFDWPPLLWVGLSPDPRPTVDYVPLLPWFGVALCRRRGRALRGRYRVDRQACPLAPRRGRLAAAHLRRPRSLPIYLIHQPILIGALYLAMPLLGNSQDILARKFMDECTRSCEQTAGRPEVCPATCGCVATGATGAGLLAPAMNGTMTPEQSTSWDAIIQTCLPKPRAGSTGKT